MRRTCFPLGITLALAITASAPSFGDERDQPFGLEHFVPVDTSRLLHAPEPPPMDVNKAFPNLKFKRPLEFTHAGDGSNRVFVADQEGSIHVFPNQRDVKETKVFLNLSDTVLRRGNEEGLLGLAFHPNYRDNGAFFVYYSVKPRTSVISRFTVSKDDPDRADRASEQELLRIPQPYENHNGGSMKFGPDGYLYIGMGDGGSANDPHGNGQNLESLHGSILRIDVDHKDEGKQYAIPKDNPFVKRAKARGEIWAKGLRNVWRLSFDRATGACWVGDVGQDHYEEVNIIVRGGNYGWKAREGMHAFDPEAARFNADFIDPIIEYSHSEGRSITGGVVYRGKRLPELVGAYLYADFVTGNVWAVRWDGKKVVDNRKLARTALPIAAFGEDEDGEVCLAAYDGHLYQLRPAEKELEIRAADFPKKLSDTGLFASVKDLRPAPGLIPYDLNVPLWSDNAHKERYLALPEKSKVVFSESDKWQFPVGTVLVKTFFLDVNPAAKERRRLETRLLVQNKRGWDGYTYLWNDEETEATLLPDKPLMKSYTLAPAAGPANQHWYFPSRSDCNACHTSTAGHVLGLNTRQMNRAHEYGTVKDNQLRSLEHIGVFTRPLPKLPEKLEAFPEWGDRTASAEARARAYLDVNCAICHAPGGSGNSRANMRYRAPLAQTFLVNQSPGQTRLGPAHSKLVKPGDPLRSELLLRIATRDRWQMPPLATSQVDWDAIKVIGQWIESMPPPPGK